MGLQGHQGQWLQRRIVAITLCAFAVLHLATVAHDETDHEHGHEVHACGLCHLASDSGKLLSPSDTRHDALTPVYVRAYKSIRVLLGFDRFYFYASRAPPSIA